ncbi:MAG: hypothetical protein PVH88_02190 [Ignavibacteria bacterium]
MKDGTIIGWDTNLEDISQHHFQELQEAGLWESFINRRNFHSIRNEMKNLFSSIQDSLTDIRDNMNKFLTADEIDSKIEKAIDKAPSEHISKIATLIKNLAIILGTVSGWIYVLIQNQ